MDNYQKEAIFLLLTIIILFQSINIVPGGSGNVIFSIDLQNPPRYSDFQNESAEFLDLIGAGSGYVCLVKINGNNTNQILVGTGDGRLLMYGYNYTIKSDVTDFSFHHIDNNTYPLPQVPLGLTQVIPTIGDINNDSVNDIVVGGNTGLIYLSINKGTNEHPIWNQWITLKDKWTGNPYQFNGTSSPTFVDWSKINDPILNGGIDLLVSSSLDKQVTYFIQRSASFAFSDYSRYPSFYPNNTLTASCSQGPPPSNLSCYGDSSYNFTKVVSITFDNQSVFFQPYSNLVLNLQQTEPYNFMTGTFGTGFFRLHFSNIDPLDENMTFMLVNFGSGQSFMFEVAGSDKHRFIVPLDSNFATYLLKVPPLNAAEHEKNADLIVTDLNNDGYADILIMNPNGLVYTSTETGSPTSKFSSQNSKTLSSASGFEQMTEFYTLFIIGLISLSRKKKKI